MPSSMLTNSVTKWCRHDCVPRFFLSLLIQKLRYFLFAVHHFVGSVSVTPRHTNPSATRDLVDGAISRVTALQAVTTRTGLTMARRPTAVGVTNTASTPRKLSQGTDRSAASRRTAPVPASTTRPGVSRVSTTGRTWTPGTRTTTKPPTTGKSRGESGSAIFGSFDSS